MALLFRNSNSLYIKILKSRILSITKIKKISVVTDMISQISYKITFDSMESAIQLMMETVYRHYHPFYKQNGWKSSMIESGLFLINNSTFTRHFVHDLPSPLLLLCNSSLPSSPFINLPSAGRTRQIGRAFVPYGDTVESLNTDILQDRLKCLSQRGVRLKEVLGNIYIPLREVRVQLIVVGCVTKNDSLSLGPKYRR